MLNPRGRIARIAASLLASAGCGGCVVNQRPVEVPSGDEPMILLASTAMPAPIDQVGRHAFFSVRGPNDARFRRIEFGGFGSGPLEGVGDERLHAVWKGAEAARAIPCLQRHASELRRYVRDGYLPWPGPNSNTFVDTLLRRCGLHADLPATAVGSDYRGLLGASATSGGTGFQVESPLVGFKLGLKEGIQLHFLALPIGIDLWPPAIIVPVGPGRIGFDDEP